MQLLFLVSSMTGGSPLNEMNAVARMRASTSTSVIWLTNHSAPSEKMGHVESLISKRDSFLFFEADLGGLDERTHIGSLQLHVLEAAAARRVPFGTWLRSTKDLDGPYLKHICIREQIRLIVWRNNPDLTKRLSSESGAFPNLSRDGLVTESETTRMLAHETIDRVEAFFGRIRACA